MTSITYNTSMRARNDWLLAIDRVECNETRTHKRERGDTELTRACPYIQFMHMLLTPSLSLSFSRRTSRLVPIGSGRTLHSIPSFILGDNPATIHQVPPGG